MMYSLYQRASTFSGLLSSCLMALLSAIALSSFLFSADAHGRVDIKPISVRWGQSGRLPAQEWAFVRFDVQSDLTSLFHWNTKQLFVYLCAEYTNSRGVKNDVVLWDRIIRRKEDGRINIEGGKNKYVFRDFNKSFRNATQAEFSLRYSVMPYVGIPYQGEAGRTQLPVDISRQ